MASCYSCSRSPASIQCLICRDYFCLTCSGVHRQNHLLNGLEQRLTSHIETLPMQFNENIQHLYRDASEKLRIWLDEIRRQLDRTLQYELEQVLKSKYELLKLKTDGYLREQIEHFTHLRSNVHYARQRPTDCNYDQEIVRLVSIEKILLAQYQEHSVRFRLNTVPIDFMKYISIETDFCESSLPIPFQFNYQWNQPMQTLSLQSTVQHMTSSGLDLFVFVIEISPKYPRLVEFSTSSLVSKLSITRSVDFPHGTNIVDMCWSIQFSCLFLLSGFYLHRYDKYDGKINGKILQATINDDKWRRLTTNRFGVYILNENNSIEFYNRDFSQNSAFNMKNLIEDLCLIHDLRGQSEYLCALSYTNNMSWQVDLFINRQLDRQRTLELSDTLRPPLRLLNANQRNIWLILDSENHRFIVFDDRMKNVQHHSVPVTPTHAAILDDRTLVVLSPDIPGTRLAFYSPV